MMITIGWLSLISNILFIGTQEPPPALGLAQRALRTGDYAEARKQAERAVKAMPQNAEAHGVLGLACLELKDYAAADKALSEAMKLDPEEPFLQDRRGDARLKAGRFQEAVADFDAVLKKVPEFAPKHWRRGIALYYAGRYADGAKQFETHRTDNPEDVENAVWHYLCTIKIAGKEKARSQLIPVTKDPRVPMKEVQALYAGRGTVQAVEAAAAAIPADTPRGTEARFYAHLYLALWAEAEGDPRAVKMHLAEAVKRYPINHYMWDIAKIHFEQLEQKKP